MTIELTRDEAKLLIAILTFAEGEAREVNPPLTRAIGDLRTFRSALLVAYLRSHESPVTADAGSPLPEGS